jgi:hypothetical protein
MFLDAFPKVLYDIEGARYRNYQTVTNIFFRFTIMKEILDNISAYYDYVITDADTPEILAEKLYNDPEAYWIILYANNIFDPQYNWPLQHRAWTEYMIAKYGSIEAAKTTVHHYNKVIRREEIASGVVTEERIQINGDKLTDDEPDIPYDYYDKGTYTQDVAVYNINGKSIHETINVEEVSVYDYEKDLNDEKRYIKLINPSYYRQIINEFEAMTKYRNDPSYRSFR